MGTRDDSFSVNVSRDYKNDEEEPLLSLPRVDTEEDSKNNFVSNFKKMFHKKSIITISLILMSITISVIIYNLNIFEDQPAARRALSLFFFAAAMWATEAIPLHITSMLIPILVVSMKVLVNSETKEPLSAPAAASAVTGVLFSGTVLVALGAFTMSFALSKYNLSYRLASFILTKVGKKPAVIMLTVMILELFLSMWINNVASPVVCISLVQPMLDNLPATEIFVKTLLLGIAYAGNIGGMTTPISSPQNLVAINTIQNTVWNTTTGGIHSGYIGWGQFLTVSLPFSLICVLSVWGFLWLFFRPQLEEVEALPPRKLEPFSFQHIYIIIVCVTTITLWAIDNKVAGVFGNSGIIGLIPVVCFFGVPILSKQEFKELSWDILMLLAGGIALGEGIQSSGLLSIMAHSLADAVKHSSLWVVLLTFASFIWLFGNFISHTVAAIIVLPVIANVGCTLGKGDCALGRYRMLVIGSVFMDSGAMGLPVTSFPNAQAFSILDKNGDRYLSPLDFIRTGFALGIVELILLMSVGFELLNVVFTN